jgi:ATP adenylyltransferase
MSYAQLKEFISHQMRMSHIYQPVMLKQLLQRRGSALDVDIAAQLLSYDQGQLEYYQNITNRMVGKVLRNRGIVIKEGARYQIADFHLLSKGQINELVAICEKKLDEYIQKRGDRIWEHRRVNCSPISGTIRYEVLKRAKFRCELCGISADKKALEVDHIMPKSYGGEDAIHNYQALCYSCNASKGDRDNTDLRGEGAKYETRVNDCLFCKMPKKRILLENNLGYAIGDKYPITEGHALIIPKRHSKDYFELGQAEVNSLTSLARDIKRFLISKDSTIKGFNVGFNCDSAAGQTIMHTHMHVVPRRQGDVEKPIGGIRNIIPGKGEY